MYADIGIIVRPLMDRTHGELVRYLQVAGQPWREDESNRDTSYLRNFVRHRLMPVSYTHLDVYKRQRDDRDGQGRFDWVE